MGEPKTTKKERQQYINAMLFFYQVYFIGLISGIVIFLVLLKLFG